jgi:hypothetical protein
MFSVATNKGGQIMGFPDVCKTPSPGGPIPIPYPNIALLNNASGSTCTKKVKVGNKKVLTKKSKITMSTGDEAGSAGGGVVSSKFKGPAKPIRTSVRVKFEGQAAVFQTCVFGMNGDNANLPGGILSMCAEQKVKIML